MEDNLNRIGTRPKPPSIGVATVAAIECGQREVPCLRGHRDPEHLVLRTGPRCTERERVERPVLDGDRLGDGGLVPQSDGVDAVGHREVHPAGLGPAGDVLHQAVDLPSGQCVLALEHCLL